MDASKIVQSHKHPTLCSVTVDGYESHEESSQSSFPSEPNHWRLASTDPRNEGKFLFRLHTIDLYFWTVEDATTFVEATKRTLSPGQVEVLDAPKPRSHSEVMSPVVQQLESIAITDPAYHNGRTKNSRTESRSVVSDVSPRVSHEAISNPNAKTEEPENYKPLAYNPAAPPAPEPIKHREKTPPPLDAEAGTGLAAAAYNDQAQAFSPTPGQSHLSPPPPPPPSNIGGTTYGSLGYVSPPPIQPFSGPHVSPSTSARHLSTSSPYAPGHRASSVSSIPPPPPQSAEKKPAPAPVFGPPPQDPNPHLYGSSAAPLVSPTTQILGNSYLDQQQPLQHLQPQYADYLQSHSPPQQPPVGGYSNYQYDPSNPHHHHGKHHSQANDYDVHSQVYRPTEEEAHSHGRPHKSSSPGQKPGRLEGRAEKAEKGVNRFLKKLEKKIG